MIRALRRPVGRELETLICAATLTYLRSNTVVNENSGKESLFWSNVRPICIAKLDGVEQIGSSDEGRKKSVLRYCGCDNVEHFEELRCNDKRRENTLYNGFDIPLPVHL
jgi:hypothetical protein